eukprot:6190601-Pleurochrysis_carterae.AAC.1
MNVLPARAVDVDAHAECSRGASHFDVAHVLVVVIDSCCLDRSADHLFAVGIQRRCTAGARGKRRGAIRCVELLEARAAARAR